MSTVLETMERKADDLAGQFAYSNRLVHALGDPSKYDYEGKCADSGPNSGMKCACEHPIRWMFFIKHRETGEEKIVGSSCVKSIQGINPKLVADIDAAMKEIEKGIREKERQHREALQEQTVAELEAKYTALWNRAQELCNQYFYHSELSYSRNLSETQLNVKDAMYWLRRRNQYPSKCNKKYSKPRFFIKWYTERIEWISKDIKKITDYFGVK